MNDQSELPFYTLNDKDKYPKTVQSDFTFEGTVNFAQLRRDQRTKANYRWLTRHRAPCCFDLRHGHAVAYAILYPSPSRVSTEMKEAADKWLSFLTGPESPWRQALLDWEWTYNKDLDINGIIIKDCRVSRALLHNFFIALRCIWEYPQYVRFFSQMIDAGAPPQAAIFYAWTLFDSQNEYLTTSRANSHTFMDTPWRNPPLLSRFYNLPAEVIPKELFTEPAGDGGFIRSNQVWHLHYEEEPKLHSFPLPPVLQDFPSAIPYQVSSLLPDQFRIPVKKFFEELPQVWRLRIDREKEVLT